MKKLLLVFIIMFSLMIQSSALLNPEDLNGKWILKYNASYGYEFSFTKSKFADIIIFMNTNYLLFKGIYQIKENGLISIEVLEMKYSPSLQDIRSGKELTKTSSSYINFSGERNSLKGGSYLTLKTKSVKIDGQNSDGFFESEIKLKKQ